jgi:hypothetical protein
MVRAATSCCKCDAAACSPHSVRLCFVYLKLVPSRDCAARCCWYIQAHTLEERMRQLQLDQQPQQQQQQQTPQPQPQTVHGSSSSGGGATDARQSSACMSAGARSGSGPGGSLAPWPAACRNPYAEYDPPMPAQVNSYTCQKSFKVG